MQLIIIIAFASVFVWLIIPLRQFRTRFFPFFLVLGLLDPAAFISGRIIHYNLDILYLFGCVILLYLALLEIRTKIKVWLVILFTAAALIVVLYYINSISILQIIIHLIILVYFLKILVVYYSENRKLLLFHLFLFAYEFSLVLKFFMVYHELEIGPAYYYLTTGFQIFIGIFFLLFNESNSPKISV